jgi:hypothetical protein
LTAGTDVLVDLASERVAIGLVGATDRTARHGVAVEPGRAAIERRLSIRQALDAVARLGVANERRLEIRAVVVGLAHGRRDDVGPSGPTVATRVLLDELVVVDRAGRKRSKARRDKRPRKHTQPELRQHSPEPNALAGGIDHTSTVVWGLRWSVCDGGWSGGAQRETSRLAFVQPS